MMRSFHDSHSILCFSQRPGSLAGPCFMWDASRSSLPRLVVAGPDLELVHFASPVAPRLALLVLGLVLVSGFDRRRC